MVNLVINQTCRVRQRKVSHGYDGEKGVLLGVENQIWKKNCECSFEHVAFEVPLRQPRGNSKEAVLPLGSCSWNSTSPTGYAHQSPGHQGKVQILSQEVKGWVHDSVFLTSSQAMPVLLTYRPHFKQQGVRGQVWLELTSMRNYN